jgi:hypothetical protein
VRPEEQVHRMRRVTSDLSHSLHGRASESCRAGAFGRPIYKIIFGRPIYKIIYGGVDENPGCSFKCLKEWSGREDLNLRPPGPEPRIKPILGRR